MDFHIANRIFAEQKLSDFDGGRMLPGGHDIDAAVRINGREVPVDFARLGILPATQTESRGSEWCPDLPPTTPAPVLTSHQ